MCRLVGRLLGSCKTVGKNLTFSGRLVARQRLKNDVVARLRIGRTIPRTVKRDEYAVAVARRELLLVIERHSVRRPMRRKIRDGDGLLGAFAAALAVAAVLRSEHQLLQSRIEVALGPAIV